VERELAAEDAATIAWLRGAGPRRDGIEFVISIIKR
jgi:hypothetical protein